MKGFLIAITATLLTLNCLAQPALTKIADSLEREGKKIADLEMTAWQSSDYFLQNFPGNRENIGGYLAYPDKGATTIIYFSKETSPKVIGTLSFSSPLKPPLKVDVKQRTFNAIEKKLFALRKSALDATLRRDTFFTNYKNTQLNFIPMIDDKGAGKVYITTSTDMYGAAILGNDYLLVFDNQGKQIDRKRFHKNIVLIDYVKAEGATATSSRHEHNAAAGDFMTATDICALMLNERYTKWKQHYTISDKYVSIWDCKKDKLSIMRRDAWEKTQKGKAK